MADERRCAFCARGDQVGSCGACEGLRAVARSLSEGRDLDATLPATVRVESKPPPAMGSAYRDVAHRIIRVRSQLRRFDGISSLIVGAIFFTIFGMPLAMCGALALVHADISAALLCLLPVCGPPTVMSLLSIRTGLAELLNETRYSLENGTLRVQHGPLRGWRKQFARSDIRQLVVKAVQTVRLADTVVYTVVSRLFVRTEEGDEAIAFGDVESMRALERELETSLGIADDPGLNEVTSTADVKLFDAFARG